MALERSFDADALPGLRREVLAEAVAAGMSPDRSSDVMLAVHELAANAVRHGGGGGLVRVQVADGILNCQVSDAGGTTPTTAAGVAGRPWPFQPSHGLWLVRIVADHLTIAPGPTGSLVTAVFALPGTAGGTADGQAESAPPARPLTGLGADGR